MNEHLIGKKLKLKNDNTQQKVIKDIVDNVVHFDDNSKVPYNRLNDLFVESVSSTYPTTDKVDLDSFFNPNKSGLAELADNYLNIVQNPTHATPISQHMPISQAQPSVTSIIENGSDMTQTLTPKQVSVPVDPWLDSQFGPDGKMKQNVNTEDIRRVTSESLREELDSPNYRPGLDIDLVTKQDIDKKPKTLVETSGIPPMFQNMKKNKKVKLNITLDEMIPNTDSIKHLNDMFDFDISIIDHLANEITDRLIADPMILQKNISEQINNIIYKKKVVSKPKTKPKTDTTK